MVEFSIRKIIRSKSIFLIWLVIFLLSVLCNAESGILISKISRQKRYDPEVFPKRESGLADLFFSNRGVFSNLFNALTTSRKNSYSGNIFADPSENFGVVPIPTQNQANSNGQAIFNGFDVFIRKLMSSIDQRHPGPESDPFSQFDISKLGLCTRETCGDLYKFVDNIRDSPIYKNLKLMTILLKDEEGVELLTRVMSDPELLKTLFSGNPGGGGAGAALLGLGGGGGGGISGLGFGSPDKKPVPPQQRPEISANIDGKSDDYHYVDFGPVPKSTDTTTQRQNAPPPVFTGQTRGPIDYAAYYYDHDPKG